MRPYKKQTTRNKNFKKIDKSKPKPLSFDQMFKRFKKKVERDSILQEVRKREFYEKPTAKRKRKKAEARARHLKALRIERASGFPERRTR